MSGNATVNDIIEQEKKIFVISQDAATGKIENEEDYKNWMHENRFNSSQYAIVIRVIREEVIPEHLKKKITYE